MAIVYTKHEIHAGSKVFSAGVVQDIDGSDELIASGAAREPTATELELYRMSHPDTEAAAAEAAAAEAAGEKRAAKAAEKRAAKSAADADDLDV